MKLSSSVVTACVAGFLLFALSFPLDAAPKQKQAAKQQKLYEVKKTRPGTDGKREWHISVGFRAGCFWWQPVWQKYVANEVGNGLDNFKYRMGPNAIYGPMLNFTFNKQWSLSWNFQYGQYIARARALIWFPPLASILIPGNIRFKVAKMDSDLLAMVTLAKFVKLFFGPRYQGYRYNEKFLLIKSSPGGIPLCLYGGRRRVYGAYRRQFLLPAEHLPGGACRLGRAKPVQAVVYASERSPESPALWASTPMWTSATSLFPPVSRSRPDSACSIFII